MNKIYIWKQINTNLFNIIKYNLSLLSSAVSPNKQIGFFNSLNLNFTSLSEVGTYIDLAAFYNSNLLNISSCFYIPALLS
jgi:hypothetical protein